MIFCRPQNESHFKIVKETFKLFVTVVEDLPKSGVHRFLVASCLLLSLTLSGTYQVIVL